MWRTAVFKDSYINTHALRGAFIAHQLQNLADLISEQGKMVLENADLPFPPRAVSTVLLIGERGEVSIAEIANALRQPHQLVTQRVEVLIALGTVERLDDPRDGRRKILRLTPQGAAQFVRMQDSLEKVSRAFGDLFEEIGCDLPGSAQRVAQALEERSVHERVRSL
jgi:DNA-binding MarR family transcriptional regulator